MAIGGLEYTEGVTTTMSHRPGRVPVDQYGNAEAPILPFYVAYVGGTAIDFYHVPPANLDNWLGRSTTLTMSCCDTATLP